VAKKVLGIYGSPRKGGNSDLLLDKALEGAAQAGAEVRRIYARKLAVSGCLECGGCDESGECVVRDDMDQVYPLFDWAQVIFLAGPIFFYSLPAQVKAVIDRAQAHWSRRLLKKPKDQWSEYGSGTGYLIAVGATRGKNLFDASELTAKYFFDALDMSYGGGLLLRQVEKKGDIAARPDDQARALELGRRAVEGAAGG
jgi:multimeric flavodoxin WrbA